MGIDPLDWLRVLLLGVVQGLTEFLPISSTGHLILLGRWLDLPPNLAGTLEISIQFGTVVAVLVYYWQDLRTQAIGIARGDADARRLWLGIMLAFLPAAAVGVPLRGVIKDTLFRPEVVAGALIVGGVAFLVFERLRKPVVPDQPQLTAITLRQAFAVGLVQVLALVPGMSRSGATILGGMAIGLDRRTATAFSFYLAIPTLGAATLLEFALSANTLGAQGIVLLLVGMLVSGVVGWASIAWLLRYVARHSFDVFGWYRIILGTVVLALILI